jgi:hypothetical protein
MRHTSETGFPESVEFLPPSVIQAASLTALVTVTGFTYRAATRCAAAFLGAVPLTTVAPRTHHDLPLALAADVHSPVRQYRASLVGMADTCDSGV